MPDLPAGPPAGKPCGAAEPDAGPALAPLYLAYSGPDYLDCGASLQSFVDFLLKERWRGEDVAVWLDDRPSGRPGYRLVALLHPGPPGAGPAVTYL